MATPATPIDRSAPMPMGVTLFTNDHVVAFMNALNKRIDFPDFSQCLLHFEGGTMKTLSADKNAYEWTQVSQDKKTMLLNWRILTAVRTLSLNQTSHVKENYIAFLNGINPEISKIALSIITKIEDSKYNKFKEEWLQLLDNYTFDLAARFELPLEENSALENHYQIILNSFATKKAQTANSFNTIDVMRSVCGGFLTIAQIDGKPLYIAAPFNQSDERKLKEEIKKFAIALGEVCQLPPEQIYALKYLKIDEDESADTMIHHLAEEFPSLHMMFIITSQSMIVQMGILLKDLFQGAEPFKLDKERARQITIAPQSDGTVQVLFNMHFTRPEDAGLRINIKEVVTFNPLTQEISKPKILRVSQEHTKPRQQERARKVLSLALGVENQQREADNTQWRRRSFSDLSTLGAISPRVLTSRLK